MLSKRAMNQASKNVQRLDFWFGGSKTLSTNQQQETPGNDENKNDAASSNKRNSKAESKTKAKPANYAFPKSYNNTHEHINGTFKDGKVNIWHWNINGINAVMNKGMLQHFLDTADPDIVSFNEIKIDDQKIE